MSLVGSQLFPNYLLYCGFLLSLLFKITIHAILKCFKLSQFCHCITYEIITGCCKVNDISLSLWNITTTHHFQTSQLESLAGLERTAIESVYPEDALDATAFPSTDTATPSAAPDKTPTGGSLEPPLIVTTDPLQNELDYRLPQALKPLHYNIKVQPFINGNYSVHGSVEIEFEVLEATSSITLHALDLDIKLNTVKVRHFLFWDRS